MTSTETASVATIDVAGIPPISRTEASTLATTEYALFVDLLRELDAGDWSRPTACDLWSVRDIGGHLLGAMEANASLAEFVRQAIVGRRVARELRRPHLDGINQHQVQKHAPPDVGRADRATRHGSAEGGRRAPPGAAAPTGRPPARPRCGHDLARLPDGRRLHPRRLDPPRRRRQGDGQERGPLGGPRRTPGRRRRRGVGTPPRAAVPPRARRPRRGTLPAGFRQRVTGALRCRRVLPDRLRKGRRRRSARSAGRVLESMRAPVGTTVAGMTSPDAHDLDVLLRILEIYLSEPVTRAKNFFRTIPDGLTFAELTEKYPRGTDEFRYFDTMMTFWETVGGLLKHGLLNEDLAFDTFLDAPPWPKVELAALALREEHGPLSATPTASPKKVPSPRSGRRGTPTTTPWPKPSTVSSRPNSSVVGVPGAASTTSSWPLSTGCTDGTTHVSTAPATTSRRRSTRRCIFSQSTAVPAA
jgi:hypothetical protein